MIEPNTKKVGGPKNEWANKLGGPNTKLGKSVPNRPTRSAATAVYLIALISIEF